MVSKWLNRGTQKQVALKAMYIGIITELVGGLLFLILFFNL